MALQPLPRSTRFTIAPFSLGRIVIAVLYSSVALYLLTLVDAPFFLDRDHFVDDVAFRAAWLTLTQIPLVYLLSAKRGPTTILGGISHERVNWAHRWVGRTILVSATTHVAIMKSSISTWDILHSDDKEMTVVRYGIATYTMLLWIAISSILPLRTWSYRVFYLNHYMSTIAFLVIVFQHVPISARPPIYLASGILALDKLLVAYLFTRKNVSIVPRSPRFARSRSGRTVVAGYPVRMTTPSASISSLPPQSMGTSTVIRVANLPFTWKPGQHVRLYIPALGRFETHAFTPANCSAMPPPPLPPRKDLEPGGRLHQAKQTSEMVLMIKSKTGFTQRLADYHRTWLARPCPNASEPVDETLTAYIDGPYGMVPDWHSYENLVLIATSTGVSFTLSILDHMEQLCFTAAPATLKTKAIHFVWTVRHLDPPFEEVVRKNMERCACTLADCGIAFGAQFWSTCAQSAEPTALHYDPFAHLRPRLARKSSHRPALRIRHPDEIYDEWDRAADMDDTELNMKMSHVEPFAAELAISDPPDDAGSESDAGTLIDESDTQQHWAPDQQPAFSFSHHTDIHAPPTRPREPPRSTHCTCALIQHQKSKLGLGPRTSWDTAFIRVEHGARPDLHGLLERLLRDDYSRERTMIAVCGNEGVTSSVQRVAAKLNRDVVLGKREVVVDVHVEGSH
ncbi:ferric-chelate reductase Frp1 [Pleosporales sp. CAS-2024a]